MTRGERRFRCPLAAGSGRRPGRSRRTPPSSPWSSGSTSFQSSGRLTPILRQREQHHVDHQQHGERPGDLDVAGGEPAQLPARGDSRPSARNDPGTALSTRDYAAASSVPSRPTSRYCQIGHCRERRPPRPRRAARARRTATARGRRRPRRGSHEAPLTTDQTMIVRRAARASGWARRRDVDQHGHRTIATFRSIQPAPSPMARASAMYVRPAPTKIGMGCASIEVVLLAGGGQLDDSHSGEQRRVHRERDHHVADRLHHGPQRLRQDHRGAVSAGTSARARGPPPPAPARPCSRRCARPRRRTRPRRPPARPRRSWAAASQPGVRQREHEQHQQRQQRHVHEQLHIPEGDAPKHGNRANPHGGHAQRRGPARPPLTTPPSTVWSAGPAAVRARLSSSALHQEPGTDPMAGGFGGSESATVPSEFFQACGPVAVVLDLLEPVVDERLEVVVAVFRPMP